MPLLLLPPPPVLSVADLVFAAQKLKWQVEQPTSGLPALAWRGRDDIVLYGEPRAVGTWAASLGLSLLGPPVDWCSRLPAEYRPEKKSGLCDLEIRFFVLDRQVVAWCAYARAGQPLDYAHLRELGHEPQQPGVDFTTRLIQDEAVSIPPALVLDVGLRSEGSWGVLRALPASTAAKFYAPPIQVLSVLQRATRSRKSLREEDRPWLVSPFEFADHSECQQRPVDVEP